MNDKAIKTIVVLAAFLILEWFFGFPIGTVSGFLFPLYGLGLVNQKDSVGLQTMFWIWIALPPAMLVLSLFVGR
jgi:hypothetical protein